MLRIALHRLGEHGAHARVVSAARGDARQVVEAETRRGIPELQGAAHVALGLVEPAGPEVRAAEVHVRGVVVAEPLEDGLVVLDASRDSPRAAPCCAGTSRA